MARPRTVWGVDIGQCALKALKLREVDGVLTVDAFEIVEHPQILSQPEADRQQLITDALRQFMAKHNTAGSQVIIAVPGQSSFSRFVKLPPVESKRVPDIVRFEAEQQIPFPITEVVWRWQTFRDPDSPDVEVGIFAIKRADMAEILHYYREAELTVDVVQMAPLALYNFMAYDEHLADEGATLLADIGAEKTDLVIADGARIWTRTIQIGGNNFTEALVRSFKLSFDKAEKLKRAAASSKYARQVFQAMRPVFADLVQEIQRSIGYYTSLHRETRFKRLVGLGNGFRLPGLQKFIEQNLNVSVHRVDSYNKLAPSPTINAPIYNDNVLSFAVAYGLALQGLQKAKVTTNLLPEEILRKRLWDRKRPWFIGAAAVVLAMLFCPVYRNNMDSKTLSQAAVGNSPLKKASRIREGLNKRIDEFKKIVGEGDRETREIEALVKLYAYRDFWPATMTLIDRSIQAVANDQSKLADYARYLSLPEETRLSILGKGPEQLTSESLSVAAAVLLPLDAQKAFKTEAAKDAAALKAAAKKLIAEIKDPFDPAAVDALDEAAARTLVKRLLLARQFNEMEAFKAKPRPTREVLVVDRIVPRYVPDLSAEGGPTAAAARRGFVIDLLGTTPLPQAQANKVLAKLLRFSQDYAKWLSPLTVVDHKMDFIPMSIAGSKAPTDMLMDEPMNTDTRFRITWAVAIHGDGIAMADIKVDHRYKLSQPLELLPDSPRPEPPDSLVDASKIKELPAETVVTVKGVETKLTAPWYRVAAVDAAGKSIGQGWIDGAAISPDKIQDVTSEGL